MKPMYILKIFLRCQGLIHLDWWIGCKMCSMDSEKKIWTYFTIFVFVNVHGSISLPFFEVERVFLQSVHWTACLLIN